MLEWVLRGLARGRVTTRWPARTEAALDSLQAGAEVSDHEGGSPELAGVCPTGAIAVEDGRVALDRGRCIVCGACVRSHPERFSFVSSYETAARRRLRAGGGRPRRAARGDPPGARRACARPPPLGSHPPRGRWLRWRRRVGDRRARQPLLRHATAGPVLDSSPRHADILLVTGGVTQPMAEPLRRAYEVMPEPRAVVAAGTDACSGGLAAEGGAVAGGVDVVLPVDVYVPGSPPNPIALLHSLLLAVGRIEQRVR